MSKSQQLLDVIAANESVFKNNYGYQEWRKSCEVGYGSRAAVCRVPHSAASCTEVTARTHRHSPHHQHLIVLWGAACGITATARTYREVCLPNTSHHVFTPPLPCFAAGRRQWHQGHRPHLPRAA